MSEESFILMDLKDEESKQIAQVISNDTSRKILDILSKEENLTATEIANRLDVGLSTVHYNLQHLIKARLIKSTDFHYSEKGKEVDHYKLSNKIVIIAPQRSNMESLKDKLKGLIPVGIFVTATSAILHFIYNNPFVNNVQEGAPMAMKSAMYDSNAVGVATDAAMNSEAVGGASDVVVEGAKETAGVLSRSMDGAMAKGVDLANATSDSFAMMASNATDNATEVYNACQEQVCNVFTQAPSEVIVYQTTPDPSLIGVWFFLGCVSTLLIYLLFETYKAGKKK